MLKVMRVRAALALLLCAAGTLLISPSTTRAAQLKTPVLLYHHIDAKPNRWFVSPGNLEKQLLYLSVNHYQSVSMAEYVDALQTGKPLPEKSVVLTFDDGYRDVYVYAFPLLKRYGFKGTFFIISEDVGLPAYLTWDMIAEMQGAGMEIGAHTLHHPFLTHLPAWRAFLEIWGSRIELENHLHTPISIFAYPYNDHNKTTVELVKLAGFRAALAVSPHKGDTLGDPFLIPRDTVTSGEQMNTFALVMARGV